MAELIRNSPIQNEYLRENRWELRFPSDLGMQSVYLSTCDKPKYSVNKVEVPYMNVIYSVAGQIKWDEMTFEMLCTIGPSSTQSIMEWIRMCSESMTGRQGYASSYMKTLELHSLDPVGVSVDMWEIKNAWVVNADFGTLDMSSDAVQKVSVTIQPQLCIHRY